MEESVLATAVRLVSLDIGASTMTNIASTTVGALFNEKSYTITDNTTASGTTAVGMTFNAYNQETLAATNASTTYTNLFGTYLGGAPTISGQILSVGTSTALYINGGTVSASTTNSYGLIVNTQVGATNNNFAAAFLGGSVGVGTLVPSDTLAVGGSFDVSAANTGTTTSPTYTGATATTLGTTTILTFTSTGTFNPEGSVTR